MAVTRSSRNPRRSRRKTLKKSEHYGRWSDLPTDILLLVLSRLSSSGIADRIRFSAVCKSWKSAWMMQPPSPSVWMILSSLPRDPNIKMYSLSDDNASSCTVLQAPHGAWFCGSFENWLVVAHQDHGNFLLNPFSRANIPLPHQTTIPAYNQMRRTHFHDWCRRPGFIRKAVLSSSPTSSDDEVIVAAIYDSYYLAICRPRGRTWSSLPTVFGFQDIIFYNGQLHAVDLFGILYIIEVDKQQIASVIRHPHTYTDCMVEGIEDRTIYLVESRGRLLMVLRFWQFRNLRSRYCRCTTTGFKVFELLQLDPPRESSWVEVNSLGGHALFLGTSCSKSVSADQYAVGGVREDCIYFTDDNYHYDSVDERAPLRLDSGVFSMEDGSIKGLCCKTKSASILAGPQSIGMSRPLWFHVTM